MSKPKHVYLIDGSGYIFRAFHALPPLSRSDGTQVNAVLGFTNINTPTIGVMIYWANQHTAMVAGVWWWIFFPVLLVVMTFIGLFLLAVSMNEYIDPRSRLSRMGGSVA